MERVEEDIGDNSPDRVRGIVEGLLESSFYSLALDQEEEATGYAAMAVKVWKKFDSATNDDKSVQERIGLPPFQSMREEALRQFLQLADENEPLLADALRVRLGLSADAYKRTEPAPEEGEQTESPAPAAETPQNQ